MKHFEDILDGCTQRFHRLKILVNKKWGRSPTTILQIYKQCARPIFEYGIVSAITVSDISVGQNQLATMHVNPLIEHTINSARTNIAWDKYHTTNHTETTRLIYWHWPQDTWKWGDVTSPTPNHCSWKWWSGPYTDMFGTALGLRIQSHHGYLVVVSLGCYKHPTMVGPWRSQLITSGQQMFICGSNCLKFISYPLDRNQLSAWLSYFQYSFQFFSNSKIAHNWFWPRGYEINYT